MKNVMMDVKGMTCGHCESAVNGALTELDGVKEVEVHLQTGKVNIVYDESKVNETQLKDAIEDQGYDVA